MKFIFHIDMNAFFASVEETYDKKLKDLPIAVAGKTKRSVVSSANYKARALGVKAAMPVFLAKKLCRNLVIVLHNMDRYIEYSDRFYQMLVNKFTDKIERLSIDECYLDVTDLVSTKEEAFALAGEIQKYVLQNLEIGTSIGVSCNKFLAKMASDMKKPLGITLLFTEDVKEKLWPVPLSEMFMIGKSTVAKLKLSKILTIGDLAVCKNYETLKNILNKNWIVHQQHANGIGNDELNYENNVPKSVGVSETFLNDTNNYDEIVAKLKQLCIELEKRLEHHNMSGLSIGLVFKDANFVTFNKSKILNDYIHTYEDIFYNSISLLESFFSNNYLRLIGVRLTKLISNDELMKKESIFSKNEDKNPISDIEVLKIISKEVNKKLKNKVIDLACRKIK